MARKHTQAQRKEFCRRHRKRAASVSGHRATQCLRDDETDQHEHKIACHGAVLILFVSHVATDDVKDQHAHKTYCKHEMSQTLLLVET